MTFHDLMQKPPEGPEASPGCGTTPRFTLSLYFFSTENLGDFYL